MGVRNFDHAAKAQQRKQIVVPNASGDYAEQYLEFGAVPTGVVAQSFARVTAWFEGQVGQLPNGVVAELWIARLFDATSSESGLADADYAFSGKTVAPAGMAATATGGDLQFGMGTWDVAGIPAGRIRFKSGGTAGSFYADMVAF